MPVAETRGGMDVMDMLRGFLADWKAGKDGVEVAKAASEVLDIVTARLARVRERFPGLDIDLGDDVAALAALRARAKAAPPRRLPMGLSRAAIF
jgi:hypothetical protein